MFNGNFHHPLDNLIKDDRLFMMEAILPFVDDRMKAPLAMYIKIMELQTILNALRDTNYVYCHPLPGVDFPISGTSLPA